MFAADPIEVIPQRLPSRPSLADERIPLAPDLVIGRSFPSANPAQLVEYLAPQRRRGNNEHHEAE